MAHHRSIIRRDERRRNRSKKTSRFHTDRPRLVVYRSLRHFEAQIIDDFSQNTIVAASSKEKVYSGKKVNKTELASLVGESLAERAKSKKVISVYFDRNGFKYHGRVRSLAEASRKGGLKF